MAKILTLIKDNCPQNHPCPAVKVCPVGALSHTHTSGTYTNIYNSYTPEVQGKVEGLRGTTLQPLLLEPLEHTPPHGAS